MAEIAKFLRVSRHDVRFLPLLLVVFVDLAGVGLIIPVMAPLLLDPASTLVPSSFGLGERTTVLGLLTAAFSLAQFFAGPILGSLSDQIGRKKVLQMALIGRGFGYFIMAWGIITSNLPLLFLSRLMTGFSSGDLAVAFSAASDLSKKEDKAKNFGLLGMAFGLGFIVGPLLGGKLSDPTIMPWFNHATPFWFAMVLTVVNIIFLHFLFTETLHTRIKAKLSPLTGFRNLKKAWQMKELRSIFAVIFLSMMGMSFFMQFFQVFLIEKFQFNESQIGNTFAFMGLCMALSQGLIVRPISAIFNSYQAMAFSLVGLSISYLILIAPNEPFYLFLILPMVAIFQGINNPNSIAIVSDLASPEAQGEVMGIRQSITSVAMALPPLISGIIIAWNLNLPIIFASVTVGIAWILFLSFFRHKLSR
jgi:DHA1 family tetracycline resistance protein-like MFS transporter